MELEKRIIEGESKRVNELEVKVSALQQSLAEERQGHAHTTSTMDERVQTTIEEQELLASLHTTIADQVNLMSSSSGLRNGQSF